MLSRQEEQSERREVLENDKRVREQGSTFLAHTHNGAGGRFAAISSPTVIGAEATPKYPQGPAWCADQTGIEPPLNIDVNAIEPCGEPHEIRASIASLEPCLSPAQGNSGDPASGEGAEAPPLTKRAGVGSPPLSRRAYRRF
jgi:hypothetical protein